MTDTTQRVDPSRHITTLLTTSIKFESAARTLEAYGALPRPLGEIFKNYAENIRFFDLHYSYPLRIYVDWMGGRIKDLLPSMTQEQVAEFAPLVDEFIEQRCHGVMKQAAYAHALSAYVSIWSIYETFLRKFTREAINLYPHLLDSPGDEDVGKKVTKQISKLGSIDGTYVKDGITCRLGDLLVPELNSKHDELKKLIFNFATIGASPRVRNALEEPWLRTLEQRRNTVAHKAGIIDAHHVAKAGEGTVGSAVVVSPWDTSCCFERTISVAFQLGAELSDYLKAQRQRAR